MMKSLRCAGFSFIEVLIFIIVSSMLMSVILLGANNALRQSPAVHQQWDAMQIAQQCMEWFITQRSVNGYASITCPSTPAPTACSAPSGFSVSASVACTTWNSDANYKTITVTVSGLASVSLSSQIGNY